ncbi:MAG: hypothetical protein JSS55_08225 [Proteobacteria bacterium]|nr:hypothetical protein [Pseudomonadota bacterium]
MARTKCAAGVALAAVAAGPAFVAATGIALLMSNPDPVPVNASSAVMLLLFLPAIPFGAIMACLPIFLGALALSAIGCFDEIARLPVVWALAGAGMAGIPALLLIGGSPESAVFVAAFAWTGAICALIARAGTQWYDD